MSTESISTSPSVPQSSVLDKLKSGPVLFWSLAVVFQLPLLMNYLLGMWRFEHYQYIPFLLIAVAGLAWSRLTVAIRYPDTKAAGALLVLSQVVLLAGSVVNSPWFASVSFFLLATSFLVAHRLVSLSIPLLLLIRVPLNYDVKIITELQSLTTRLASYILDLLYVPHLAHGNVLELADRELFVAEACSGVQSAFTIGFIALLIAAWRQRPLALVPVYLGIALVWAVLCNTIRVTTIAFAAARLQWDLSEGLAHDILGYGTLLLAALLTLSTDYLLTLVFHSIRDESDDSSNPFVSLWQWFFDPRDVCDSEAFTEAATEDVTEPAWRRWLFGRRPVALLSVALLGCVSFFPLTLHALTTPQVINAEGKPLIEPPPNMLDDLDGVIRYQFSETMRGNADPRLGMNADQWVMKYGPLAGTLVFSQPYSEWHDLTVCYTGQGWSVASVKLLQPRTTAKNSNKVKYATLQRRDGMLGYLFYSGLNADGSVIDPPEESLLGKTLTRCRYLITGRGVGSIYAGDCAMLQMWMVTDQELTPDQLGTIADSMAEVRDRFAAQLIAAAANKGQSGT